MKNKDIFSSKLVSIIISFLIALLLWAFAITQSNPMSYKKYDNLEVNFLNTQTLEENNLTIVTNQSLKINLKIYGKNIFINSLNPKDIIVYIDFSDISKPGSYTLPIQIRGIDENIFVVQKNVNSVTVEVDKIASNNLPISNFRNIGKTKDGYSVISINKTIESAKVSGLTKDIEKVKSIIADVNVSGKNSDFQTEATLKALDKNGNVLSGVEISPKTINVDVKIGLSKWVNINPVLTGKLQAGYTLSETILSTKKVQISGKKEDLDKIDFINTLPVDISNLTSVTTKNVALDIPSNFRLLSNNNQIDLTLVINKNGEKTFFVNTFKTLNLKKGLTASVVDKYITLTIKGDPDLIKTVTSQYFTVNIDLENIKEIGISKVEYKITTKQLPDGVKILLVTPDVLSVDIGSEI